MWSASSSAPSTRRGSPSASSTSLASTAASTTPLSFTLAHVLLRAGLHWPASSFLHSLAARCASLAARRASLADASSALLTSRDLSDFSSSAPFDLLVQAYLQNRRPIDALAALRLAIAARLLLETRTVNDSMNALLKISHFELVRRGLAIRRSARRVSGEKLFDLDSYAVVRPVKDWTAAAAAGAGAPATVARVRVKLRLERRWQQLREPEQRRRRGLGLRESGRGEGG